jgi:hypothetical protein
MRSNPNEFRDVIFIAYNGARTMLCGALIPQAEADKVLKREPIAPRRQTQTAPLTVGRRGEIAYFPKRKL